MPVYVGNKKIATIFKGNTELDNIQLSNNRIFTSVFDINVYIKEDSRYLKKHNVLSGNYSRLSYFSNSYSYFTIDNDGYLITGDTTGDSIEKRELDNPNNIIWQSYVDTALDTNDSRRAEPINEIRIDNNNDYVIIHQAYNGNDVFISKWNSNGDYINGKWFDNQYGTGLYTDKNNDIYYIDFINDLVRKISSSTFNTVYTKSFSSANMGNFTIVDDVLYIVDNYSQIEKYNINGNFINSITATNIGSTKAITADSNKNLYFYDNNNKKIRQYDFNLNLVNEQNMTFAQFLNVNYLKIDKSNQWVYAHVTEFINNNRTIVQRYKTDGTFQQEWLVNDYSGRFDEFNGFEVYPPADSYRN